MSNPTTKVATFAGSLGGFTGVDPIRYDTGLWLESAGTNYVYNPVAAIGTTNMSPGTNITITQETSLPGPLPGWLASRVTTGYKFTATGAGNTGTIAANRAIVPSQADYSLQVYVWVPTAFSGTVLKTRANNFVGASVIYAAADLSKRDQWQKVVTTAAPQSGDLDGHVALYLESGTMLAGESIWATCFALQDDVPAATPSSVIAEVMGAGYANTVGAHASPSTRAASSASISPAGILAPDSGSLAFRVTPTIETGVEEIWGECGAKGAGTDHLRWGRDSTKHPFVEWSSNDVAYQRLTASETWNALAAKTLYLGYNGTTQYVQVDSGTLQSASRDAVSGSWGAGNLKLQASKGGNIVTPFSAYSEHLNDTDRALVIAAIAAGGSNLATVLDDAAAPLRTMNIRTNALLRQ